MLLKIQYMRKPLTLIHTGNQIYYRPSLTTAFKYFDAYCVTIDGADEITISPGRLRCAAKSLRLIINIGMALYHEAT